MPLERMLTDIEARIIGCLIEKEATTPDQYPLTLNALRSACNQKSSRFPVTDYEEGEVGHALRQLGDLRLVSEISAPRAARYKHHIQEVVEVLKKEMAVLCVLMLRGPQTAGEIRTRCSRIHEFEDLDDLHYVLERLKQRHVPLAMTIPRGPGQKDDRHVHLLCGEPDLEALEAPSPRASSRDLLVERIEELTARVEALERRLDP